MQGFRKCKCGNAEVQIIEDFYFYARCKKCGRRTNAHYNRVGAQKAWNNRFVYGGSIN